MPQHSATSPRRLSPGRSLASVPHYLAALDLALADRLVTLAEADQLGELAQPMCLGAEELLDLHRSYLTALAAAAVADGVVTREVGTGIVGESACLQMLAAMEVAAATAVLVALSQRQPDEDGMPLATVTSLSARRDTH